MTRKGPPRHAAIAAALRERISRGELVPGSALPSESQLCEQHGVSRGTVRQALAALRAEGLISGGRGRVPVVRRANLAQSFDELVSFSAWARELGRTPSARTLELARRPAPADAAEQLEIAPGTAIFALKRLRLLDDEPMMLERTSFVEPIGRLLLDCDLDAGSIYAQLGERGVTFAEADQTIAAVPASVEDVELLAVARRAPLLEVRRRALAVDGTPLEWSVDRFRGDAFAITVHNQQARPGAAMRLHTGAKARG